MESGLKNIWKLDEYFDISSLLKSLDTKEISYQNEMKVFVLMFPQVWSVCKTISELSPLWWNGNAFYSSLWERDARWMHREVKYLCIGLSMSMVESSWLRWALSWGNRHVYTVWTGSICFKIARSIIESSTQGWGLQVNFPEKWSEMTSSLPLCPIFMKFHYTSKHFPISAYWKKSREPSRTI